MKNILSRILVRSPNGSVPPRQSVFRMGNPLILLWIIGVLETLIFANGGGLMFVAGAGLTVVMTVALGYQAARGLIALINKAMDTSISR